jgi:hypothetical protein
VSAVKKVLSNGCVKSEVFKVIAKLKNELTMIEANSEKMKKDAEEREKAKE